VGNACVALRALLHLPRSQGAAKPSALVFVGSLATELL
jgi:hypothetical protein